MRQQIWSARLRQAVAVGMVVVDEAQRRAVICAPPRAATLTDDDWIAVLQAASEMRRELERLGYVVEG